MGITVPSHDSSRELSEKLCVGSETLPGVQYMASFRGLREELSGGGVVLEAAPALLFT